MLTALDIAHRELGFMHGDMRIANIMEHRPRDDAKAGDNEFVPRGFKNTDGKLQSADEFKLPGESSRTVHCATLHAGKGGVDGQPLVIFEDRGSHLAVPMDVACRPVLA